MMMTVLSTCLVAAPKASAASNGDLIKKNGLAAVYYLANGKRYVFPNAATYFSWYPDFNGVKTITETELESYPLAQYGNVTVRPGTKLVKSPTNPLVYAVEPGGILRSIVSEANAKTLYGDNWNKRILDVLDEIFNGYNNPMNPLTVGTFPAGSLIKTAGSPDVYYVDAAGKARKFGSEAAFVGNHFSFNNVMTAATLPTVGDPITGMEDALINASLGAGGKTIENVGSGLTAAVAGDTAPSRNVPSRSTLVPFLSINLTAAADGDTTVNSITFTRKGTGAASDFAGGYLYLGNERLTTQRSVNTSDNTMTFTALNLKVPAGMTKQLVLKMDAKTTADVSGNHYFEITKAADISTNGSSVSGSFPMSGNTMTYSTVNAATVTVTGANNAPTYKIGESNVVISEFTIANNDKEVVTIKRIRLKQNQTAGDNAVTSFNLDLDGTVVAKDVKMVDKYVDFVLDKPLELAKSKTITATVRGNVVDDIGKFVELYLKNETDLEVAGSAYGDFYGSRIVTTAFNISGNADYVTISGSEINVSFDGPVAADVKDDSDNVVLANFKIKSANQDVNFEALRVTITNGTANNLPMTNLELVDSANNASYSVSDPASSTTQNLAFENILLVKGVQYNFQIRGDIQDNSPAGSTYLASIAFNAGVTARYQDSDETAVVLGDFSTSALTGKLMTVAAPAVTFAKVTTTDSSVVKNAKNVLLYKGKIYANDVDVLKVSKIKLNAFDNSTNARTMSIDFDRLYLYKVNTDGTETKLDDETSLGNTGVSFSGFTQEVPKGVSNGVTFVVRGDVKASPTGTTTRFKLDGTDTNYTVKDSDNNALVSANFTINSTDYGQRTTVVTLGTYTMIVDTTLSGLNNSKNVLAGTRSVLGSIKLTANKEAAKVEDLVIQNFGSATNDTLATLYLYDNVNLTGTALASTDMAANKKAKFTGLNIAVPTSGATYLYIAGLIKPIDYSASPIDDATAVAATDIALFVPADASGYTTKVTGKDTGEVLTNTSVTANVDVRTATSTVMGAVVSAVATSFKDKGLPITGMTNIFSFKVSAPASTNVDNDSAPLAVKLGTVTFTIATSGVNVSALNVERVGGSGKKVVSPVITTGGTFTINFPTTYGTDSDLKIKPGEVAEYIISATVSGSDGSGDSISVYINNLNTDMPYTHNKNNGTPGEDGSDTSAVYPLISGITTISDGSSSN